MAKSKFKLGFFIGALTGIITGLFASEKPGKKLRKDALLEYQKIKKLLEEKNIDETLKKIFNDVGKESKKILIKVKDDLAMHLSNLGERWKSIDKEKYLKIVDEVIKKLKKDKKIPEKTLSKLKKYLEDDFEKIKKEK